MAALTGKQFADLVKLLEQLKGKVVGYGFDGANIPAVEKAAMQATVTSVTNYFTTYFS